MAPENGSIASTLHDRSPLEYKNPNRPGFWVIAGLLFLLLAALSAGLISIPPHDLWWQLKTGQIIAQEHRLPTTDRFSYTARGEPWLVQEWLSELIFYLLQHRFGYDSLVYLQFGLIGLMILGLTLAGRFRGAHPLLYLGGTALTIRAIRPWFSLRPQLFTYAGLALLFACLEAARRDRQPLWLLPILPLVVLWANLHAGVLVIFIVFVAEGLGAVGDALHSQVHRSRQETGERWAWAGWLAGTGAVAAFLTLLNPHGIGLWTYPAKVTGHPGVIDFISEWFSPNFHSWDIVPLEILFFLTLAVLIVGGPRPPYRDFFLLLPLFCLGMMYRRHLPIFGLAACPILVGRAADLLREWDWNPRIRWDWIGAAACVLALFPISSTLAQWPKGSLFNSQAGLWDFPVGAVRYLHQHPPPGPLWHDYRWGGYLIWNLPSVPVFIDGRAEVYYRKGVYDDYVTLHNYQPGSRSLLEKYKIRAVLAERNRPLVQVLLEDPKWWTAYQDVQAVVLVRGPYAP